MSHNQATARPSGRGRRFVAARCLLALACALGAGTQPQTVPAAAAEPAVQTFDAKGVVKEVRTGEQCVVIAHEAIGTYMGAMTMPFKVRDPGELAGLRNGDRVSFRLRVTETESWIEQLVRLGAAAGESSEPRVPAARPARLTVTPAAASPAAGRAARRPRHPLMDFPFTNELGQRVTLGDFHGQALAITFFFTRCPIPDFCPRLSKNFEQASQTLESLPHAPTNWHFLSVSFDTEFDTPAVLRAYGARYHYDPKHWSFLTGPADKIRELASLSDVTFEKENGFFNHNFRTLVIDAAGHLQMTFPVGGDLSGALVTEMLKAAAATNQPP